MKCLLENNEKILKNTKLLMENDILLKKKIYNLDINRNNYQTRNKSIADGSKISSLYCINSTYIEDSILNFKNCSNEKVKEIGNINKNKYKNDFEYKIISHNSNNNAPNKLSIRTKMLENTINITIDNSNNEINYTNKLPNISNSKINNTEVLNTSIGNITKVKHYYKDVTNNDSRNHDKIKKHFKLEDIKVKLNKNNQNIRQHKNISFNFTCDTIFCSDINIYNDINMKKVKKII